jgi:glycosyltransferase involved in cell wall biosynthesis
VLVVEGRGRVSWLGRTGLDLRGLTNLYQMANTPDPRDFYGVSRLMLMPSLCRESYPRVAVESCINGIPVLASNRAGLAETLAQAGRLFEIPARYTPETTVAPSAAEVAPWVEAIMQLWDDETAYAHEQQRCRTAAQAWHPDHLLPRFEKFFATVRTTAPRFVSSGW